MYRISRHQNGLTVATAELPHMASISLGIWVAVGGRFEKAADCGVSHFIEHLLFKGTPTRTAKQISQDVEGIGGYLNAFTTEEHTCYFAKACSNRVSELLEVLTDMYLNSTFAEVEIEKERNVIKEELAMYLDQPQHLVQEILNQGLWPEHPLGRPLTGTNETLDQLTRPKIVDYQHKHYVTHGTLIAAAGNIDHEKFVKRVSRFAPQFKPGERACFSPVEKIHKKPSFKLYTKSVEQSQLSIGYRTCSRHDPRRFALRILNTMLGENMSSRLFQVVREDHGLAYSICSSLAFFDDAGCLTISAGVETDKLQEATRLIFKEIRNFTRTTPEVTEIRRARDYLIGQMDLSLENSESQMMWVGEYLVGHGEIIHPSEIKRALLKVTPADVKAAATEFFQPTRLSMALVSDIRSDPKLLRFARL